MAEQFDDYALQVLTKRCLSAGFYDKEAVELIKSGKDKLSVTERNLLLTKISKFQDQMFENQYAKTPSMVYMRNKILEIIERKDLVTDKYSSPITKVQMHAIYNYILGMPDDL